MCRGGNNFALSAIGREAISHLGTAYARREVLLIPGRPQFSKLRAPWTINQNWDRQYIDMIVIHHGTH
jgi:hypothetical protein